MITKFNIFENHFDLDPYGEEKWENEFNWHVICTSSAELPPNTDKNLLRKKVLYTLNSLFDVNTPHGEFKNEQYNKVMIEFPDNDIVEFQYNKSKEFSEKTVENTIIEINTHLILRCEYDIEMINFEPDDVEDWARDEGYCELIGAYLFNSMEEILSSDNEQYPIIKQILTNIRKNCRATVT